MAGLLRVPRTRGALSGVVLVVLGACGAIIPFLGPWVYTPARLWLEIFPGVAAAVGGLILLGSANRAVAAFGAWLATLAGVWFIIGPAVGTLWISSGFPQIDSPVGGTLGRALGLMGLFTGLGVVIVFFAALALGRLAVVATRDTELAAATAGRDAGVVSARDGDGAAAAAGRAASRIRTSPMRIITPERSSSGNGVRDVTEPTGRGCMDHRSMDPATNAATAI